MCCGEYIIYNNDIEIDRNENVKRKRESKTAFKMKNKNSLLLAVS